MELKFFCNRAIELQEKYQKEHDRDKLEILSQIVKNVFMNGEVPYSFDIEYQFRNAFDLIEEETFNKVFEDLSIEYSIVFNEESMTQKRKYKARFVRKNS